MRTITFWLSLILILMIPTEKIVLIGGESTLTKFFGILVAGCWFATVVITDRFRRLHPFHFAVFIFVFWNVVSLFWTVDLELSLENVTTYLQLVGLILILWDLYTTPEAIRAGLQAYVLGGYISIGSTLLNYLRGTTVQGSFVSRYGATGFDANDLSLILGLGLPIAWYLAIFAGKSKGAQMLKLVNYAYVPIALLAMLLTASRGGLFASTPAFLFIMATFTQLKLVPRILIFIALIAGLFGVISFVPQSSFDRIAGARESIESGNLTGRVEIWLQGLEVFLEKPVFGVGANAFRSAVELGFAPHNTYLSVLVELGVIGFILFLIMLVIPFFGILRLPRWETRFWLALLMIWAIGVFALTWAHRKPTWLFLSLAVASAGLPRQQEDEATQPAELHVPPDALNPTAVRRDGPIPT